MFIAELEDVFFLVELAVQIDVVVVILDFAGIAFVRSALGQGNAGLFAIVAVHEKTSMS